MNNLETRHPDDGQLLRYLDGELAGRKAKQVRRHLEACWQCRSALEELQNAVSDCVRYRKSILAASLPPPPAPWKDLSRGFAQIDAEVDRGSLGARMLAAVAPPQLRWGFAAAAAVAVVAAILYQLRETPSVQAAALLKRAVAAADSRPNRQGRIRIKTQTAQVTRTLGKTAAQNSELPRVESLFRAAHYSWDDPLSARSFQAWRAGLAEKTDRVSTTEDRGTYQISTTSVDGELVAATLTLRIADLEPTEGRFEFRGREWVEITELADLPASPASEVAEATGGIPSKPDMPPPHLGSPQPPPATAGVADELQVVAALHRVGADLGDPLNIARTDGKVVVSGTGIPIQRQRQIRDALESMPHVTVHFSDDSATPPSAPVESADGPAAAGAASAGAFVPSRLQEKLGGRAAFERFSSRLLDRTEGAMAHAYALKRLAQEFPPEAELEMQPEDRRLLATLAQEHLAALSAAERAIAVDVRPFLPAIGAPGVTGGGVDSRPWQTAAAEVLRDARQMETGLAMLLGIAAADPGVDPASRLAAGIASLKSSLGHCQRLLSYDDSRQRK